MGRIYGWAAALSVALAGAAGAQGGGWNETAFAHGPIQVIAPVGGKLRTYRLVPCRDGTRICAGSAHGRAGRLTSAPGGYLVAGAYGGLTFALGAGGGGTVSWNRRTVPLAWAHEAPHR